MLCTFSCTSNNGTINNEFSSILESKEYQLVENQNYYATHEMRIITTDELCNPNKDTLLLWEKGVFLDTRTNGRDYKKILSNYLQQKSLSAVDIETLFPTTVEEMNWYYAQLTCGNGEVGRKMEEIDSLMTLYADRDTLSCLSRFLNMYLLMDPRIIDREWMGDWNLNRVMYGVIPDNKQSLKAYYDTLDVRYDWVVREWCYAYQNF